jgi:hypothetical protein
VPSVKRSRCGRGPRDGACGGRRTGRWVARGRPVDVNGPGGRPQSPGSPSGPSPRGSSGAGRVLRGEARERSRHVAGRPDLGTASMGANAWVGPTRDRRSPSVSGGTGRRADVSPDDTRMGLPPPGHCVRGIRPVERPIDWPLRDRPAPGSWRPPSGCGRVASGCRSLLVHCLHGSGGTDISLSCRSAVESGRFRHDLSHASDPGHDLGRRSRPRAGIVT